MNRRRQREEAKLDAGVKALLNKGPEDYTPSEWQSVREHLRLVVLYPGKYVAFRDCFKGEGQARRLVQRQILRTSTSLVAVSRHIDRLPEKERQGVLIDFVEPAETSPRGQ
jgi:hypothetical protein